MVFSSLRLFSILLLLSIAFRVIPHLPNFNPEMVFALAIGRLFKPFIALLCTLVLAILSDLAGHLVFGYAWFGSWTLFTYSAFLMITLVGSYSGKQLSSFKFIAAALGSSFGFWLWTNMGTYLFSGMYPHTLLGLLQCYLLALPFLTTSLCAAVIWSIPLLLFSTIKQSHSTVVIPR